MERLEHEPPKENGIDKDNFFKSFLSTMKEITHDSQDFHLAEKD